LCAFGGSTGRASPISQVVSKSTAILKFTNPKAIQASAGALDVTLCPGAGEMNGNLEQTIHQKQSISRLSLCPLNARFVPFSEMPENGSYSQKIKDLLTHH
jgi:hypothetical protein